MPRNATLLFLCGLLVGCATAYQAEGFTGGFSATQLAPDIWQVRFKGNGFTPSERASDFVLLRTAEIMLETGYDYFVVVDSASEARAYTHTTPENTTTSTALGATQTNTYGGQTYTIYKPRSEIVAVGLNDPDADGLVFSAAFLRKSLTEKYGIDTSNGK